MGFFEPYGRYRRRDGEADLIVVGKLIGLARHARPHGSIEVIEAGEIAQGEGLRGDFRGSLKSGRNLREVTVMAIEDWRAATEEVGQPWLDWSVRRANLLVEGLVLPREPGARIRLSGGVELEVTGQTEPCERMEAIAPGLRAALTPHWRGGVTTRVISGGPVRPGDQVESD